MVELKGIILLLNINISCDIIAYLGTSNSKFSNFSATMVKLTGIINQTKVFHAISLRWGRSNTCDTVIFYSLGHLSGFCLLYFKQKLKSLGKLNFPLLKFR